ncbi:hypothetical protein Q0Z83_046730 [Actinoplanes sichuanensis]|nr:hypothetical protein Q0Z83_046730 [Actinoplanes sichuanensis]
MRREPPITFRGALQLLGHYDRPLVDRLNRLLGGVILTAGALATVPALAPLAPLWGWVDQKNEATGLLRACLDRAQDRLSGVQGYERVELVAAAHTMIVFSAFFDTMREVFGADDFDALEISAAEQEMLAAGRWRKADESPLGFLWEAEVPMPGATSGFLENIELVGSWLRMLAAKVMVFVEGLAGGGDLIRRHLPDGRSSRLADRATERYRTYYLQLARTVPDFWIWAQLEEHRATRVGVDDARAEIRVAADEVRSEVRAALDGSRAALARIETLISTVVRGAGRTSDRRQALLRANRDVLNLPVVRWSAGTDHPDALTFPTVEESYVSPSYRSTKAFPGTAPGDESWWSGQPLRTDLDLMLTTQFTTFDAVRWPLLVLGHPGGGKSMLTKILAARLSCDGYTVARVPLRQVTANAPIHDQIREALDIAAHGRAGSWFELADDDEGIARVVLLDGLDELLQATTHDRSGYLHEVIEFQRVEAAQGRPVMVVVTSRTVVVDRVDLPLNLPIAKLEEFDDAQVDQWLTSWNRRNSAAVAAGRLRPLTSEAALAHPGLARQPLLLLMLAIYWADLNEPVEDGDLSLTALYRRLMTSFAVREVHKKPDARLRGTALDEAVAEQLYRLSIAAIGMFNRGRQDITESELGTDLVGLRDGDAAAGTESLGQRVLGEFFFIHAAEARVRVEGREVRRCYEFLHATFGEYLIASLVTETLADVADAAFGGSRGRREPVDDLLFALLSHQSIASRQPILDFAGELLDAMPERERSQISQTLEVLAQGYDRRLMSRRHSGYRPLPESNLRPLAAYSANLILLRVLLDGSVPLDTLCLDHEVPITRWRTTVTLWRAGLDPDGWQAMLDTVVLDQDHTRIRLGTTPLPPQFNEIQYMRLLGDRDAELQLRIGSAFHRKMLYHVDGERWADTMMSWLLPAIALPVVEQPGFLLIDPPSDTPQEDIAKILDMMSIALVRHAGQWSRQFVERLLDWVDRNAGFPDLAPVAVAAAHLAHSGLPHMDYPGFLSDPASDWLLWAESTSDHGGRWAQVRDIVSTAAEAPQAARTSIRNLVRQVNRTVDRTPLPLWDNGHSMSVYTEDDRFVALGSTSEFIPAGDSSLDGRGAREPFALDDPQADGFT